MGVTLLAFRGDIAGRRLRLKMSSAISFGRDTGAWLAASEIVVALAREANFFSNSGWPLSM